MTTTTELDEVATNDSSMPSSEEGSPEVVVPTLAVLGTMSDAGKSTIAAGICRVLRNGGIQPAPFKAQNMSNNAHPALIPHDFTEKGSIVDDDDNDDGGAPPSHHNYGEIGVAQAVQARAGRLPPVVQMNPVLLKSGGTRRRRRRRGGEISRNGGIGDAGEAGEQETSEADDVEYLCDVVVLGRTVAVETFGELGQRRDVLLPLVLKAHEDLIRRTSADVVVMEGAGSCTELNLMSRDIVNLPLVRALQQQQQRRRRNDDGRLRGGCKWLLVANIDCGGVFAQVVGTKACLPPDDWDSCVGIVINKLRGEAKYFEPGPQMIEDMVGKPVFVVPFLRGLNLPEEDGLGIERRLARESQLDGSVGDDADRRPVVLVIAYPFLSMADDVVPLENDPRFRVQWRRQHIPAWYPAAILLPGSRITCLDLRWLHDTGWADYVRRHAAHGGRVLGICGGYQMLGVEVRDPHRVEGDIESQRGLGLLPLQTTLIAADVKTISPRSAKLASSSVSAAVHGFELHCGRTCRVPNDESSVPASASCAPLLVMDHNESHEGLTNGRVAGTYLHGILESPQARAELLIDKEVAEALEADGCPPPSEIRDPLDHLAQHLSSHGLDFDAIMKMLAD